MCKRLGPGAGYALWTHHHHHHHQYEPARREARSPLSSQGSSVTTSPCFATNRRKALLTSASRILCPSSWMRRALRIKRKPRSCVEPTTWPASTTTSPPGARQWQRPPKARRKPPMRLNLTSVSLGAFLLLLQWDSDSDVWVFSFCCCCGVVFVCLVLFCVWVFFFWWGGSCCCLF